MRKFLHMMMSGLLVLAVFTASVQDADAASRKRKNRKDKTEAPEVKKTAYQEFMEDKDLVRKDGFMNLLRKEGTCYLEIPETLVGRKIISSTRIEDSTDPSLAVGTELSSNQVLVVDRTDSLILLRRPASNIVISDGDAAIARALSGREPILYSFPIKYRNADSTAYVVEADALFDISSKAIVDLEGISYDDCRIAAASVKSEGTLFKETASFGESVGVRKEATFQLSLAVPGFGFIASEKPVTTVSLLTTISLLPEDDFKGRLSDSRIGTRHEGFTEFVATGEIKQDSWAQRWDIRPSDPVVIYVDTLMGPAWMKAVEEGIMAWEPAFDAIGLPHALEVRPYPSDSTFMSSSPLFSTVSFVGGHGTSISASILADATNGRIMSCRMTVPGDYIAGVHRRSVYSISDVDARFRTSVLPQDAVCEVLKADVMKTFGLCLGLTPNMAGSAAYSPEQLRDPAFTAAKGITASVTDDVLFNYLARPGDKERGVVTIIDRIGAYDRYAIEWLYRPFAQNEKASLDSIILSKNGNPEYFYAGRQRMFFDSRALANDLGNDIFEAYDAGISHVRYVAETAQDWIDPSQMDDSYMELFYDWLWMRFNSLTYTLSSHVGAINTNDPRSGLPKMETLPVEVQRKAMKKALEAYMDVAWLGENKTLMHMSGAYKDVSRLTLTSILQISGLTRKLPMVAMAEKELGNDYTTRAFMKDLRNILLADARKGQLREDGYDIGVAKYLVWLISNSDVMKQNYKDFMEKSGRRSSFAEDALRIQMRGIPVKYTTDLETVCYESLVDARRMLQKGKNACRNAYDRNRFAFLISLADAALGK